MTAKQYGHSTMVSKVSHLNQMRVAEMLPLASQLHDYLNGHRTAVIANDWGAMRKCDLLVEALRRVDDRFRPDCYVADMSTRLVSGEYRILVQAYRGRQTFDPLELAEEIGAENTKFILVVEDRAESGISAISPVLWACEREAREHMPQLEKVLLATVVDEIGMSPFSQKQEYDRYIGPLAYMRRGYPPRKVQPMTKTYSRLSKNGGLDLIFDHKKERVEPNGLLIPSGSDLGMARRAFRRATGEIISMSKAQRKLAYHIVYEDGTREKGRGSTPANSCRCLIITTSQRSGCHLALRGLPFNWKRKR